MEDTNYIYAQAKVEYTKQLIDLMKDCMFDKFIEIYKSSKEYNSEKTVEKFRIKLEEVPKWNQSMIDEESETLIKCDWFEDLITAVYLTHTKILLSVGKNDKNKKIDLVIPKTNNFIHKCYISIARELWKNPYLYEQDVNATEYQRNIKSIEEIICEAIQHTVRSSLPVKDILKGQLERANNTNTINDDIDLKRELFKELIEQEQKKNEEIFDENVSNIYTSEPSEEQIKKNTEGIVVNDDLLKQDKEEQYDNPTIFSNKKNEINKDDEYIKMIKKEEEYNNNYYTSLDYKLKDETITLEPENKETEIITLEPENKEITLVGSINNETKELNDKVFELPNSNEKKITFTKDKDETDTLDNFFDDLQEMTHKDNSYSLYDK